jgi:NAD(P)-dependent dehydrogenase (short-subunit alcohol dehydrogenase family)
MRQRKGGEPRITASTSSASKLTTAQRSELGARNIENACTKLFYFGIAGALLLAVLVWLFVTGVPRQFGFYTWLASISPDARFVGMSPAFNDGIAWNFDYTQLAAIDLTGQRALVTGANSGLGFSTSMHLARQGATVIMACRSMTKCEAAATKIRTNSSTALVETMVLDTSSLASVRAFSNVLVTGGHALDMLYLNAGIASAGKTREGSNKLSEDGIEMVMATNVIGHHLLYKLVEPLLQKAPTSRVVLTASAGNFGTYDYGVATDLETLNAGGHGTLYSQSKFAQVLWAGELTRRLGPKSTIYVNSCHPGAVDTGIWNQIPLLVGPLFGSYARVAVQMLQDQFMWTGDEGAITLLYLGAASHGKRGKYFHPQAREVLPNALASDTELQRKFWAFCEGLVAPP